MDSLKEMIKNVNPVPVAIALVVIIAFVGISVARCSAVHAPAPEEQAQEQAQEQDQGQEQRGLEPTDEQQALIDAYDAETSELVSLLTANSWTAQNEGKSLSFTESSFCEADGSNGSTSEHTFAIASLDTTTSTETGANGESRETTVHQAAILTESETYLMTVRQFGSSTANASMSVSSNAFTISDSYVLSKAAEGIAVSGINEAFDSLISGNAESLKSAVVEHCSRFFPTATNAEWTGLASADWETGTVTTSFELNNSARSIVSAVYNMQTGEVTVE